jgi:hypothetical protein
MYDAPGITFHWSGKWVHKLNMHTDALYWDNNKLWHAGNDGSGSGLDADTVDSLHASAFAKIGTYNNLTHTGNEFTFASSAFSGPIWFNYRTASGSTDGNITRYYFGNGKGEDLAYISNGYFSGTAAAANSVAWSNITGKPSTFTPSSHTHAYLPLAGGTMTGTPYIYFPASVNNTALTDNTPTGLTYGRLQSYGTMTICGDTDGSTTEYVNITAGYSIANATAANGLSIGYSTLKWKGNTIWHAGNDGHGSGLDADTVDGYHATMNNNKPWGTIPVITTTGWMDVGRHFEFHYDNTTGSDYSTLLTCTGNHSNVVNLPSASGTLALTS